MDENPKGHRKDDSTTFYSFLHTVYVYVSIVIVKTIDLEILTDLHVFCSPKYEKAVLGLLSVCKSVDG
jgi:hypothetical protein